MTCRGHCELGFEVGRFHAKNRGGGCKSPEIDGVEESMETCYLLQWHEGEIVRLECGNWKL